MTQRLNPLSWKADKGLSCVANVMVPDGLAMYHNIDLVIMQGPIVPLFWLSLKYFFYQT